MRFQLAEKPVTTSAEKSKSGRKLSVTVERPVYESPADFQEKACGNSADRFTAWLNSQAATEVNNDVRAFLREWEPEKDKPVEPQIEALYREARKRAKEWDAVPSRKAGTGQAAQAKALKELATAAATGSLKPEEIAKRAQELAKRFGFKAE